MPDSPPASLQLEELFHRTFTAGHNAILKGGAAEPFYQPPSPGSPGVIFYTRDYVRSALHEVSHWCIAGEKRRMLPDYGYWYNPDDRNARQQTEFQHVEVLPQALELVFSAAMRIPFRVSLDNFGAPSSTALDFETLVLAKARFSAATRTKPACRALG
jgi:elongation factor P hydroxylase